MKKIISILLITSVFTASIFACTYNEKTHELKECKKYIEDTDYISDKCRTAHEQYNQYVAAELGKKVKDSASRLGNELMKFLDENFSGENFGGENSESED